MSKGLKKRRLGAWCGAWLLLVLGLLGSSAASAQFCNEPLAVTQPATGKAPVKKRQAGGQVSTATCYEEPPREPPPPPPSQIVGNFEGVGTSGASAYLHGWACSSGLNQSIAVHVYVGGAAGSGSFMVAADANQPSEPAVAAACSAQGTAYRFHIPLTDAMRQQHAGRAIYVHGISPVGQPNALINGSGAYAVPAPPANVAPSIQLTAPAGGAQGIAPASIILRANASDPDDAVAAVDFYGNGQLLNTDTAAPYEFTWGGVAAGTHTVYAVARDTRGGNTASSSVAVSVSASQIIGSFEGLSTINNVPHMVGWACSTGLNQSIDIHPYVGGAWPEGTNLGAWTANLASEPQVAATCSASGTAYRFSVPITDAVRQQHAGKAIHIHGISPVGQPNLTIGGSGNHFVPAMPAPPPPPPMVPPSPTTVTRHFIYDQHQQLCKVVEPETRATVMDYDAAGNLQWSASGLELMGTAPGQCDTIAGRDSGRKVTRHYDARNRLVALEFPDGNGNQTLEYWPTGKVRRVTTLNDAGTTQVINTYSYNKRQMLTGESSEQPGWYAWGVGYGYDGNGNLASQSYPTGGTVAFAPNGLGQATQVAGDIGTFATGVSYYPNGAIRQFTYGNGVVHSMTQNDRQLPSRVRDLGGPNTPLDYAYHYDANGNVNHIWDHAQDSGNGFYGRWMEYDNLDRLTAAGSCSFGGDCWHRFTYDALDNIKSWRLGGVKDYASYNYDPATHRLMDIRNGAGAMVAAFEYDPQGNLSNKNGRIHIFDTGNRLRGINGKETYRYDALGRRVLAWRVPEARTDQVREITLSVYSQSGALVFEHTDKDWTEHVYLSGSRIGSRTYNFATNQVTPTFHHTDALGSPVATTNAAGAVIERTQYEPYGAAIGKAVQGIGYTGHVMDAATGLTYMQQRYYDPSIGRFLSVDPVEANGHTGANFNRYKYALNNPYKFTDPDGRCESIATCQMMRDDLDVMAGRMSREEHSDRQNARGVGAAVGVGLLVASRIPGALQMMAQWAVRQTPERIISTLSRGAISDNVKGNVRQIERSGGDNPARAANREFDRLTRGREVTSHSTPNGTVRSAELKDGSTISVRDFSKTDGPTIQINRPNADTVTKVRYVKD